HSGCDFSQDAIPGDTPRFNSQRGKLGNGRRTLCENTDIMTLATAYNVSVLAVALWGFTALLLTGEFNPAIILACYGLSAWAFATRSKKRNVIFWNILTFAAFGGAVWLARESLLNASVYFFMFLQIAKLFNNRSAADARWIY